MAENQVTERVVSADFSRSDLGSPWARTMYGMLVFMPKKVATTLTGAACYVEPQLQLASEAVLYALNDQLRDGGVAAVATQTGVVCLATCQIVPNKRSYRLVGSRVQYGAVSAPVELTIQVPTTVSLKRYARAAARVMAHALVAGVAVDRTWVVAELNKGIVAAEAARMERMQREVAEAVAKSQTAPTTSVFAD